MMKKNNRLYQYLIVLITLVNTSFVLASDSDEIKTKEQAAMPPAPSGPYRSQIAGAKSNQNINKVQTPQLTQRPIETMPAQQLAQRPPQAPMTAPNLNNRVQRMPVPQWAQRPPQQPMPAPNWNRPPPAPPAWVNRSPQRMPVPQWAQRPPQQPMPAPNWNRPPPAPPAWVNRSPQRMPVPQWAQRPQPIPVPQWVQPRVPDWVKNPPRGPKPPAWVTNPPKQPMYQYGNPGRNY